MKKPLAFLLSFCLLLYLSACQNYNAPSTTSSNISTIPNISSNNAVVSQNDTSNNISDAENITSESASSSETSSESSKPQEPLHQHSYTATVTKEATCIEDGIKTFTCSCKSTYTETISATGHTWSDWFTAQEPTISSEGVSRRQCGVCKLAEDIAIPKLPADASSLVTMEQLQQIEQGFLMLVNQERNNKGASSLTINNHLDDVAQKRSSEVIDTWSHTRPNGQPFYSLINETIYPYTYCGENLCMTTHVGDNIFTDQDKWVGSAQQIEAAYSWIFYCLKNSPNHYENMINTNYQNCGIGISYVIDDTVALPIFYVAHIFGSMQN